MTRHVSVPGSVDPATIRTVSEICRFLLARLDDDEAIARKVARARGGAQSAGPPEICSPERLRRECDARRHLVGTLQQLILLRDQPWEAPVRAVAGTALIDLARCYAEHPGFRTRWTVVIAGMTGDAAEGRAS